VQLDYAVLNPQEQFLKSASSTDVELRNARELGVEMNQPRAASIPEDRVRYHHCWGSGNTPHVLDIHCEEIAPLLLKINAQAYGVEAATRGMSTSEDLQGHQAARGQILIQGWSRSQPNVVEHPDLIAWRIKTFAMSLARRTYRRDGLWVLAVVGFDPTPP